MFADGSCSNLGDSSIHPHLSEAVSFAVLFPLLDGLQAMDDNTWRSSGLVSWTELRVPTARQRQLE